jgi:hypothetical protein
MLGMLCLWLFHASDAAVLLIFQELIYIKATITGYYSV